MSLGIFSTTLWLMVTAVVERAASSPVAVVPYKAGALSPVRVHVLQPICRPEGLPWTQGITPENDGTIGFYVLFRTGGIHRQTLLCTNGNRRQKILVDYVPGKIDESKVPVEESGGRRPKTCAGLIVPEARMLDPETGATLTGRHLGLFYAISDPENAMRLDVHFVHGKEAIEGHGTTFEVSGLPKTPAGFVVTDADSDRGHLLPARTTYEVELTVKPFWATPGICNTPRTIGELTTGS